MAICKPIISTASGGFVLPLAMILASSSTAFIWGRDKREHLKSSNDLKQIEQRIRNLETICTREDFNLPDKLEQSKK